MANWNINTLAYDNQSTRFEVMMVANSSGVIFDRFPIYGNVTFQSPIAANTYNNNFSTDAFGRLRISEQFTIFDSNLRFGDDTRNWTTSNTIGSTYTHANNESTMLMSVGNLSGQKVVRRTKRYFAYQPGKSLLFLNSFVMNEGKAGLRQRVGNFDDDNGIFFEINETTCFFVRRGYASGSVQETRVPQSQWNVDPLNGLGPSGLTLNKDKAQILWTDIEWLGAGSVRTGFIINGQFIICHVFHHANIGNTVYMTTATLPIRYEIENTSNTASSSTLKHICNSVVSEGGYSPSVETRAASTALTGLDMITTEYRPLVSVRLKADYKGAVVVPSLVSLYGIQNTPFSFRLIEAGTVTGGSWVSAGLESSVEYNTTGTGFTGGNILLEDIFIGGPSSQPVRIDLSRFGSSLQLKTTLAGINETLIIACKSTTNNDDALATLIWEEYN